MAFDVNLLELVNLGGHYMAPNVYGWAKTLTEYQRLRGYGYRSEVCQSHHIGAQRSFTNIAILRILFVVDLAMPCFGTSLSATTSPSTWKMQLSALC